MPAASAVPKAFGDPGWNGYTKNGSQDTIRPPIFWKHCPTCDLSCQNTSGETWMNTSAGRPFSSIHCHFGLATSLLQSSSCHFFESPNSSTFAWNMLGEATLFAEAIYCRANGPNSLFNGTQQFVRLACPLTAPCHENGTFFRATKVERGQFLQKKLRYPAIFWISLMILGLEPKLQMLFQLFVSKGHAGHHLPT